jgi:hypothetical protein
MTIDTSQLYHLEYQKKVSYISLMSPTRSAIKLKACVNKLLTVHNAFEASEQRIRTTEFDASHIRRNGTITFS